MIARGHLSVKVAVPCATDRTPIASDGIFHEKAGIIQDRGGDRIAWNGSLNETAAGWRHNWESINVYTSWGTEPERVAHEEGNFARLWAGRSVRVIVLDVPEAVRRDLMRFMPDDDLPARLQAQECEPRDHTTAGATRGCGTRSRRRQCRPSTGGVWSGPSSARRLHGATAPASAKRRPR